MRLRWAILCLALLLGPVPSPAESGDNSPPPDLVRLERQVGLRIAHARDEGLVEPAKRELVSEAEQDGFNAEHALKAGNYDDARDYFERADKALSRLGF